MIFQNNSILLLSKPYLWTSFDVVNYVRKALSKNQKVKVGHAGTLDPLATGLLIICTGEKTKTIEQFLHLDKEYTGTIVLGATTPSYDLETDFDANYPTAHITEAMILQAAQNMQGELSQMPPIFSAKKINGKAAYKKARLGEEVILKPAQVQIHLFEITRIAMPEIDFRVRCSKGTYIRSLAHDFGKNLQSGAYLKNLQRTKIGDFQLENALVLPNKKTEV